MSDETRKHEYEVLLDAPAGDVWRALTTGEGIRQWFARQAEVEPGLGGKISLGWGPGMEGSAPITAWEPDTRIAWTEDHGASGPRVVEFILEAAGGQTKLRMVHSGFGADASFDDEFESTNGGWLTFLACLHYYTGTMRSAPGRHEARITMPEADPEELWTRLTAGLGLGSQDWSPGAPYRASLPGGGGFTGVVIASPKPRYAVLRVDEMGGSLLVLACERCGGACAFTASWYLFGTGLAAGSSLLSSWNRYYDALTSPQGAAG